MSIEQKIDQLTAAINALTAAISARPTVVAQPVEAPATKTPEVAPAPVVVVEAPAPTPVVTAAPIPVPKVIGETLTGTVSMPPLPTFNAVTVSSTGVAPFSDQKGMIGYVTDTYRALGARGGEIQNVIVSMGVSNINEVPASRYGELYQKVEALKNGA